MIEPLHSVESAAKTLSLSPWTVRAYIRQGRIRPVRIGRRVLISEDELQKIVKQGLLVSTTTLGTNNPK